MSELQESVAAYLAGASSVDDLQDSLADHVQPIAEAQDAQAERLLGRIWGLISEYSYGHRDEPDLKRELAALLERRAVLL